MARAPPQGNVFVGQNVSRAFGGKRSRSDGEHIGPTAETIGDQRDVGVTSRGARKRAEVVDGNARTFRERHGDDWPTYSQPRGFPRLAHQAVAKPPSGVYMHADPPVKPFQHAQCTRGAKVATSHRMASLHDPRAHEQVDVDTNRLVVQQASSSPRRAGLVRRRRQRCRITDE